MGMMNCRHGIDTSTYCPSCVEDQLTMDRMAEIRPTLQARGSRYGDFSDNAEIADALLTVFTGQIIHRATGETVPTNWENLDPIKRQALVNIAGKISRILSPSADPEYRDNWHDIQGYAKLAEERCK